MGPIQEPEYPTIRTSITIRPNGTFQPKLLIRHKFRIYKTRLSDSKMRFVKYGVETWRYEIGNKRRSVNYELFLKNSKKRSKS